MIAKFQVMQVEDVNIADATRPPEIIAQRLTFQAVSEKPFHQDGTSDDNSFAKWTPDGKLTMTVNNPALFGKLKVGEKYYLTFTKAD